MRAPLTTESVWAMGSRTVVQACRETCLSRQELWERMDDGTLVWFAHGGRGTRLIAWASIVAYLEREHEKFEGATKESAYAGQVQADLEADPRPPARPGAARVPRRRR